MDTTHWSGVQNSSLPPLDLVDPAGQPVTIRALADHHTTDDLADRLGIAAIHVGGRALSSGARLVDAHELRNGVRIDGPGSVSSERPRPVVDVAVVSGPCVSPWIPLPAGRHVIGRAPTAAIRLDAPGTEPHHVLLDVHRSGRVEVTQLSGAVPVRRGDDGPGAARCVATLEVGASVVGLRRHRRRPARPRRPMGSGSIARRPSDPWRRTVWRGPSVVDTDRSAPLVAPGPVADVPLPPATGLVGVATTAIGAVVIASILGNAMFLLFAAMGAIAAVGTFGAQAFTTRRTRRRRRREHADAVDDFRTALVAEHERRRRRHELDRPTLLEVTARVGGPLESWTAVWDRRVSLDDPLVATAGVGLVRSEPAVEGAADDLVAPDLLRDIERCSTLEDAAAPFAVAPGETVAVHGPATLAIALVRSVLVQLAVLVGPADWRLVVVSRHPERWRWVDWLPHGAVDGRALVAGGMGDQNLSDTLAGLDASGRILVVVDDPELLTVRTGPLRRFLASTPAASAIVLVPDGSTVPVACRRSLVIGSLGRARWSGEGDASDAATDISIHGATRELADRIARSVACLVDPEDDARAAGAVPASASFGELLGSVALTSDAIVQRWREAGPDPAPVAPIGISADGRVDIDLVRDGPHGLVAGTTGSGKSELLRTLVLSLAVHVAPEHLNFVLVDYKGGSTFDACNDLPHTVGVVTDLDDGLAERALASLDAELHRRERLLRDVGAADLGAYRRSAPAGANREAIARLVVVIDEFAAMAKELPDFLAALVDVARRGRSLGVHLLLATQRPAGVVNDDIRANTNLRLALRLNDVADAVDVVGDAAPAAFARALPGRAALRLGPDDLVTFQSAHCSGPRRVETGIVVESRADGSPGPDRLCAESEDRSELAAVVAAVNAAADVGDHRAPHQPWTEPLPFPLRANDLDDMAAGCDVVPIGWIDDPQHQRHVPLAWVPTDGSLSLIGSPGSGTTSTLIALATAVCRRHAPDRLHLYVVDSRGDTALDGLAGLAHCGAVVRLHDDERLHRLLNRLVGAIDASMAGKEASASTVLMIDGVASLRAALAPIDRQDTFDLFQRVLTDGPAAGVAVVAVDDDPAALARVPASDRWIFHLDDPTAASAIGGRIPPIPAERPGRLRIASTGQEAQVAQGAAGLASLPSRAEIDTATSGAPDAIRVLPEHVAATELASASARGSVNGLLIGLSAADIAPVGISVEPGDHVLVVGGPRSGVSTALRAIADRWRASEPGGGVVEIHRRDDVPGDLAGCGEPTLVVIDDAHRVDDSGVLAEVIRGDHSGVTILAGGRADAVRTAYGHWTREVAKSRCGIVLTSRGEPDGDVLGVQLPRRAIVASRPGLGWIVDGGPLRLAQIAGGAPSGIIDA